VPLPTEAALRDLYHWNALVLALAAKQRQSGFGVGGIAGHNDGTDIASSTAGLFLNIARATGNTELTDAVGFLNNRLNGFRRVEGTALESVADELAELAEVAASGDMTKLARELTRYHRRRIVAVASILAHSTRRASN